MRHITHESLRGANDKISITLVGCGGTGSLVLQHLYSLHRALVHAWNHPGLDVYVYDDDTVSEANIGRQSFYPCDIGHNKAEVLVYRYNVQCGTDWENIVPVRFGDGYRQSADILISCVDSAKSRLDVIRSSGNHVYHIDCGNGDDYGQVAIGGAGLPWPEIQLPELIAKENSDPGPSCSLAEALERQNLFVNRPAALYAAGFVESLLRYGGLDVMRVHYRMRPALFAMSVPAKETNISKK